MSTLDIILLVMTTLKDIAEKCSVSIATVSNILNGKANVSEETKERILQVVKETGFKPNYMARRLRASKTQSIGILIDDLTEFSSPQIINGIMACLEDNNYKAILENLRFYSKWGTSWYDNKDYEKAVAAAFNEFLAIKVDGIIYVAGHAREINCIPKELPVPVVLSYAFTTQDDISTVEIDDTMSAYNMTKYLLQKGHNQIAVIAGARDNIHTLRRLEGLKKALAENNLKLEERLLYYGDWKNESGYEGIKFLINSHKNFSALFCFNDIMAAGAYDYLNSNASLKAKISIVGFDNRMVAQYLKPSLTTMEIPLFEVGNKSAQIILSQIDSEQEPKKQECFIPCSLIERDSVKKI